MQTVEQHPPLSTLFQDKLDRDNPDTPPKDMHPIKQQATANLHMYMDTRFHYMQATLEQARARNDTETILQTTYRIIEEAFVDHLQIDRADNKRYKAMVGRGTPTFNTKDIPNPRML